MKFYLPWPKECIIPEICILPAIVGNPTTPAKQTTGATIQTNNTKIYVPTVNLSIYDNIKFSENIKQGFKKTISWNKYRSGITTQPKNNNLDYLIEAIFWDINRFFVLLFKNDDDDPMGNPFDKYYVPLVTHSLTHWLNLFGNFLSIADLRVDGRNTYQQSQCSPQNNSNSLPEYTRLYLPLSTSLPLLPAIPLSICLDPTL